MPLVLACFDGSNTVEDARVETRSAAAMEPGELARKHSGGNGERKVNGISDSAVTSLGRIEIHVIRLVLAVRAVFFFLKERRIGLKEKGQAANTSLSTQTSRAPLHAAYSRTARKGKKHTPTTR
jgi:hypothetical protein